jgi:hypothetical protein
VLAVVTQAEQVGRAREDGTQDGAAERVERGLGRSAGGVAEGALARLGHPRIGGRTGAQVAGDQVDERGRRLDPARAAPLGLDRAAVAVLGQEAVERGQDRSGPRLDPQRGQGGLGAAGRRRVGPRLGGPAGWRRVWFAGLRPDLDALTRLAPVGPGLLPRLVSLAGPRPHLGALARAPCSGRVAARGARAARRLAQRVVRESGRGPGAAAIAAERFQDEVGQAERFELGGDGVQRRGHLGLADAL